MPPIIAGSRRRSSRQPAGRSAGAAHDLDDFPRPFDVAVLRGNSARNLRILE